MPGLRYDHRLSSGPYEGEDCRIVEQPSNQPEYLKVKVRARCYLFLFPISWIVPRKGRKHAESKNRP